MIDHFPKDNWLFEVDVLSLLYGLFLSMKHL